MRVFPPHILVASYILQRVVDRFAPIISELPASMSWAAWLLIPAGLIGMLLGVTLFRRRGITIRPFEESSELMTTGIYRFTRNPMYLGMTLVLAGTAVRQGSLSPWFFTVAFPFIIYARFIRWEEAALTERFGDEYRAYCGAVRRWI